MVAIFQDPSVAQINENDINENVPINAKALPARKIHFFGAGGSKEAELSDFMNTPGESTV
jgi:hypothetical protein